MGLTKYILSAAAFAGAVLAQCNGPNITIRTSSDASAISNCGTYNGDVIIDSSASGQISLNGVTRITGNLLCQNATGLTAITSDKLSEIDGTFGLSGLTILSTLEFDSLSRVNKIYWVGLPGLQGLNFGAGVSQANQIYISNTLLNNLNGIELTAIGSMDINNNPYLSSVNVNSLTNVTTALSFSANAKNLQISLPNLQSAANLTFIDCSNVSMPSLAIVGGAMGFYSDSISTFSAPNLTQTNGALAFVDLPKLSSLNFPMLQGIGAGFLINNTGLTAITGFPKLKTVIGALSFAGNFSSVDLPSLSDLRGGSNVQTTSTNSSICTFFNNARSNGIIKGLNTCITGTSSPNTNPTVTGSGSSATKTGAANPSYFNPSAPLTGLSAMIAALLFI